MKKKTKLNEWGYNLLTPIMRVLFKLWYNPTIVGKEYIPKEGSIIIASNHKHVYDQCLAIMATKRNIHYMAKKEYFDKQYKEGKFPWFFKGAGCIPVDRTIKDSDAVDSALEVLNDGYVLGLFPEGTRNAVKESRAQELYDTYKKELNMSFEMFYDGVRREKTSQVDYFEELMKRRVIKREEFIDNIFIVDNVLRELVRREKITEEEYYEHIFLPFKFGAVSMAHKTNALVVPFVTTGEYKFRSHNLNVVIGKPIKVSDNLEESNKKLRQEMIELYKESLQMTEK